MSTRKIKQGARFSAFISQDKKHADIVDIRLRDEIRQLSVYDILELGSAAQELLRKRCKREIIGRFMANEGEVLPEITDLKRKGHIFLALRPRDLYELSILSGKVLEYLE